MPIPSAPTVKPSDTVKVKKIVTHKPRPTPVSQRIEPTQLAKLMDFKKNLSIKLVTA